MTENMAPGTLQPRLKANSTDESKSVLDGNGYDLSPLSASLKDFESSNLYSKVYNYVQDYMSRYDVSHDFNHVLRVLSLAKYILVEESQLNASAQLQEQAIILGALLHDVADRKYVQDQEAAEKSVSGRLLDNGCPPSLTEKVSAIVRNVSYSNEMKHADLVRDIISIHPELAIVQDADRLDAIGAVGIGRVFAYGAVKAPERGLQGSIDHFTVKLENLEGMMKTQTGKRLARERTQRLKVFRQWWEEENQLLSKTQHSHS